MTIKLVRIEGFKLHYGPEADFRFLEALRAREKTGNVRPEEVMVGLVIDGVARLRCWWNQVPTTKSLIVKEIVEKLSPGFNVAEWYETGPITVKPELVRWLVPTWVESVITRPGDALWIPTRS